MTTNTEHLVYDVATGCGALASLRWYEACRRRQSNEQAGPPFLPYVLELMDKAAQVQMISGAAIDDAGVESDVYVEQLNLLGDVWAEPNR